MMTDKIIALLLAAQLAYICIGGFAWALTPESWGNNYNAPAKHLASIFWPLTLLGYIVYRVATFGPRLVKAWRERNKIPRAEVHR